MSGWSGPRIRSRSVRVCSYSGIAWPVRPACLVGVARLLRVVRVSGWSGPRIRSLVGEGLLVQRDRLGVRPAAW